MDEDYIRELITATVDRALERKRIPRLLPGTVIDENTDNPVREVSVLIDGDTAPIVTSSLIGATYDGQRVMVLFYPPSGSVIIGYVYDGQVQHRGFSVWSPPATIDSDASIFLGNNTEDEEVSMIVTDSSGREAIEIGTRDDGTARIRINNSDNTAAVFEVTDGSGSFPLSASAWQPAYHVSAAIESGSGFGYRRSNQTSPVVPQWTCILSLTTDRVRWEFDVLPDSGMGWGGQLVIGVRDLTARTSGAEVQTVVAAGLISASPQNVSGTLAVPAGITAGGVDPVGSLVLLRAFIVRTTGAGGAGIAPLVPGHCVA